MRGFESVKGGTMSFQGGPQNLSKCCVSPLTFKRREFGPPGVNYFLMIYACVSCGTAIERKVFREIAPYVPVDFSARLSGDSTKEVPRG